MLSRKNVLALLLTFIIPSVMLVSLQQDSTNRVEPNDTILLGYFSGTGPLEVVGSESAVSIVEARCLMRGLLGFCEWVGGEGLRLYNAWIQFLFVWAALSMIYLTAARLMPSAQAGAAVLLAVVFVPWGYLSVSNCVSWPYDLPALFFSALGMWAVVTRRFTVLAVTVVLGTLNKETVVFLLPAYVLAEWSLRSRKTLILQTLTLAGLFAVAYEVPRMILAGNHSPIATFSATEWDVPRWRINLQHLILEKHGTMFENIYWVMSLHLLPVLRWSTLPRSLRMMYLAVPVLLVPIFFAGNIYELRLYNEIIPLGAIGTVFVFARLFFDAPAAVVPVPALSKNDAMNTPAAVASNPTVP